MAYQQRQYSKQRSGELMMALVIELLPLTKQSVLPIPIPAQRHGSSGLH